MKASPGPAGDSEMQAVMPGILQTVERALLLKLVSGTLHS